MARAEKRVKRLKSVRRKEQTIHNNGNEWEEYRYYISNIKQDTELFSHATESERHTEVKFKHSENNRSIPPKPFNEELAISYVFAYNINEPTVCRSSRQEYDERVCLTSVNDGVL